MQKNPRVVEALAPLKKQLEEERDEILKKVAPLHRRRERLLENMRPIEAELRKVEAEIDAVEIPRMREVGNELAGIARHEGAITLTNGAEE